MTVERTYWGINIGWMTTKYFPRTTVREDQQGPNPAADAGGDADDDWGRAVAPEWGESPAEIMPAYAASLDFKSHPAWIDWFSTHVSGGNQRFMLWIEDRDDLRLRHTRNRRTKMQTTSCYAPAEMFGTDVTERDVLRGLYRDTYVYAARKRDWPEPPPLPPYFESAQN